MTLDELRDWHQAQADRFDAMRTKRFKGVAAYHREAMICLNYAIKDWNAKAIDADLAQARARSPGYCVNTLNAARAADGEVVEAGVLQGGKRRRKLGRALKHWGPGGLLEPHAWSVSDTTDTYTDQAGNTRYRVKARFSTEAEAVNWLTTQDQTKVLRGDFEVCGPDEAIEPNHRRIADRIDGYDRDDLGESPDYFFGTIRGGFRAAFSFSCEKLVFSIFSLFDPPPLRETAPTC